MTGIPSDPSPEPFQIRFATLSDMETVAAIEAESFPNPWQPQTFRSLVSQDRVLILVAVVPAHGVVGYTILWRVQEEGELANLAVRRGFQKRGIGSGLLDRALSEARAKGVQSVFLEVRMSNGKAFDLYRSRGFKQVTIRKAYYQNPREDARILVVEL